MISLFWHSKYKYLLESCNSKPAKNCFKPLRTVTCSIFLHYFYISCFKLTNQTNLAFWSHIGSIFWFGDTAYYSAAKYKYQWLINHMLWDNGTITHFVYAALPHAAEASLLDFTFRTFLLFAITNYNIVMYYIYILMCLAAFYQTVLLTVNCSFRYFAFSYMWLLADLTFANVNQRWV